ncbi:MAG TPA: hypothetical protein VK824_04365 [Planctomycetota bacterium]|nr:hypothetical protein [Planctomycetota bacterium]
MNDSNRLPLMLVAVTLVIALAGVLAPRDSPVGSPATSTGSAGRPFELVLFGTSRDGERLAANAQPLPVYRVPAGTELWITDIDATSAGLVLWRGSQQHLAQVGFVTDRAAVGLGQSARSYASGIRFGPEDQLLVGPAGCDIEWAALRGFLAPAGQPVAGP